MQQAIDNILTLLKLAERLKCEMRHSWLSNGRQESVAEHSWQMALMAVLMHRYLEHPVDLERTLIMIIVHDLVEAQAGDVPFLETGPRKDAKAAREQAAIEAVRAQLGDETGEEIYRLWHEFEEATTPEARFAKALDNLEVQVQHNLAALSTWEDVEYDLVYTKLQGGGIDVDAVKQRLGDKVES